jgi:hypothetical protein
VKAGENDPNAGDANPRSPFFNWSQNEEDIRNLVPAAAFWVRGNIGSQDD